jgi:hypothetical protein
LRLGRGDGASPKAVHTASATERLAACRSGRKIRHDVPLAFVMTFPVITGVLWAANYITPPAGNVKGECPAVTSSYSCK